MALSIHSKALPELYFGRLKDPEDPRDFSFETFKNPERFIPLKNASSEEQKAKQEQIKELKKFAQYLKEGAKFDINDLPPEGLPKAYDFIPQLSDIRNQLSLGSCTRKSVGATVEYINLVKEGIKMQDSTLFGYKKTRDIQNAKGESKPTGDTGATLRTAMKALRIYGYVDEKDYPYKIQDFDKSIPAYLIDIGKENQGLKQLRIDTIGKGTDNVLFDIKKWVWYEVPVVFGFWVYDSCLKQADKIGVKGKIPYPDTNALEHEQIAGGHAVTIVGYNDEMLINNISPTGRILGRTKGAVLIRNSWGKWGEVISINGKKYYGYGWIPYEYIKNRLATDFWVNLDQEFMNLKVFDDE